MEMANKNIMLPRINIPYWVSASVQGALLAATRNDNADKTQNVSIDPAHALAAGIAVAACRWPLGVAFSYAAALFTYLPLQLNISMIARMPQGY